MPYMMEATKSGHPEKEAVWDEDTPPNEDEIRQCLCVDATWNVVAKKMTPLRAHTWDEIAARLKKRAADRKIPAAESLSPDSGLTKT